MRAFSDRFIALVCALGVLAAVMTAARAGSYEDGLLRFTADSFDDTIEGINAVATSGNPLAASVIGALQEGRLLFSADSKQLIASASVHSIEISQPDVVINGIQQVISAVRTHSRLNPPTK